jgi:hypothetical protein
MRPLIRYGSFALSVCHFRRPKRTVRVRLDSHLSWQSSEVSKVSMINRGEGILCAGHAQRPGGESPLCNLMEVKHE